MNVATLLEVLEATYGPPVAARGGKLQTAADPEHALGMLAATAPRGFRVVVLATGVAPGPDDAAQEVCEIQIAVVVQGPSGLPAGDGESATRPRPGAKDSLLATAAWVDRVFRGFAPFDDDEAPDDLDWFHGMRKTGGEWLEVDGARTRNWQWSYGVIVAEDAPETTRPPGGQATAGSLRADGDDPVFTPWGEIV